MAKFLNTAGVSYHLEELIKSTKDRLILISPYLQFNERIKEHINNLNIQKKDIRIIYRENKLRPDENNWLSNQIGVRTSICKNLHAKCYINEVEAIKWLHTACNTLFTYLFVSQNRSQEGTCCCRPVLSINSIFTTQRFKSLCALNFLPPLFFLFSGRHTPRPKSSILKTMGFPIKMNG